MLWWETYILHPMGRAPCCSKIGLNRGPWTPEEDALLAKHIEAHGEGCWRELPKAAGLLRCGKSCRLRWVNYLRPTVKRGNISEDEEDLIIKLHSLLGNRWSLIAARIPGRTDNEIKNYWNTHLRKKLTRRGTDPKTHKVVETSNLNNSRSEVDHGVRQPDPFHKATTNTENWSGEDSETAVLFSRLDCCCHREFTFEAPASTIALDNDREGQLTEMASSSKLEEDLSNEKVIDVCSSAYCLEKNSSSSKEPISNYDYTSDASSPRCASLKTRQIAQYSCDCPQLQESVSTDSSSSDFVHLGIPSVVLTFLETTSSPPSTEGRAMLSSRATETFSLFNLTPPTIVENVANTVMDSTGHLPAIEMVPFDEKTYTSGSFHSLKVDMKWNSLQTSADNDFTPLSKEHALLNSRTPNSELQHVFSEERLEREMWNSAEKLASAEFVETTFPLLVQSDCSNISGCSANYLDFQEHFETIEWKHFNFYGSEG